MGFDRQINYGHRASLIQSLILLPVECTVESSSVL